MMSCTLRVRDIDKSECGVYVTTKGPMAGSGILMLYMRHGNTVNVRFDGAEEAREMAQVLRQLADELLAKTESAAAATAAAAAGAPV